MVNSILLPQKDRSYMELYLLLEMFHVKHNASEQTEVRKPEEKSICLQYRFSLQK